MRERESTNHDKPRTGNHLFQSLVANCNQCILKKFANAEIASNLRRLFAVLQVLRHRRRDATSRLRQHQRQRSRRRRLVLRQRRKSSQASAPSQQRTSAFVASTSPGLEAEDDEEVQQVPLPLPVAGRLLVRGKASTRR